MEILDFIMALFSAEDWSILGAISGILALLITILVLCFGVVPKIADRRALNRANQYIANRPPDRAENRRKVFGRDVAAQELRERLTKSGRGAVSPVATGGGGIGKTTLALHYRQKYARDYAHIHLLRAETEAALVADLAVLATRLDPATISLPDNARADRALDLITQNAANNDWLLIYDNVENPQLLDRWKANGRNLHILLTSRFPDWHGAGFDTYRLGVLSDAAAIDVLRNESGRDDPDFPDLAKKLGNLPIALVQAGEWLRAYPHTTVAQFQHSIDHLRKRHPVPGMEADQDRTTVAIVEKTLRALSKDARALVNILAWWDPDTITTFPFEELPRRLPMRLPIGRARHIPRRVWRICQTPERLDAAMAELRAKALLDDHDTADGQYRMHRIYQDVVRAQVKIQGKAGFKMARSASTILAFIYPSGTRSPQHSENWPACRILTPHVQALWQAAEPLWSGPWSQPGWAAMDTLLNQSGIFFSAQENRPAELACKRASLHLIEARLGPDHRDIPLAKGNLALTLAEIGDFVEAASLLDEAIALDQEHRPNSADLAARYMQQANLHFRMAEAGDRSGLPLAEDRITKARGILETLGPASAAGVALCWNELGFLRGLQSRPLDEAEAYEKALTIQRDLPGIPREDIATSAMNVGSTYLEAGKTQRAEPLLREAYDDFIDIYAGSPGHSAPINAADWLIFCLLTLARKGDDPTARRAEAQVLCTRHGLDLAAQMAQAENYP